MDTKIRKYLNKEKKRQKETVELIASENFASKNILALQGSIFTNKYAEGYPSKRYYGGCENVDAIESLAIDYAKKLFNCSFANVQPHSGSSANLAIYKALINNGDKVMSLDLKSGGHLTHGHSINFSGLDYTIVAYELDKETGLIDYEKLEKQALKEKPKMIIAGGSAYPRELDFKRFKSIADKCGALLWVDMAHIAGLVATGLHQSPLPYADVVTSTTHKTLRGPRGGFILTNNEDIAKKIDKTVFPGIQGGPLMHVIAAKAQCFYEALQPDFKIYQRQVLSNAKHMANFFLKKGCFVASSGTDTHLFLLDVKKSFGLTGKIAQSELETINITVNKNTIPNDTESPWATSGIRIGTPAMTTKGFKEKDFEILGEIIYEALKNYKNPKIKKGLKAKVQSLLKETHNANTRW